MAMAMATGGAWCQAGRSWAGLGCPSPQLHCFDIIYAYLWVWLALTCLAPFRTLKTVIKLILCSSESGRGRKQGYRRGNGEGREARQ